MKRKTRASDDWDAPLIPNIDVPDHIESPTGILDANGREIKRQPRPIGFGRWS